MYIDWTLFHLLVTIICLQNNNTFTDVYLQTLFTIYLHYLGLPLTTTIAITVPVVLIVIVVIVIVSVVILVLMLKKRLNYNQEKDLNVQPNKFDVDLSDNTPADKKEDIVL